MNLTFRNLGAAAIIALAPFVCMGQTKSAKRGVCWDEKTQKLTDAPIEKMLPGVSWVYNWGIRPSGDATRLDCEDGMGFLPMCWSLDYNEGDLRSYIEEHPGVKYLLGYNEPNFLSQAKLTPRDAAADWVKLEKIAADYNLKLVAPALNFTGDKVGGRTWTPYEWLDEFVKQYKLMNNRLPKIDCLALHCYMNWYGAHSWFALDYFYTDLYDPDNEAYDKYPDLKELMGDYKMHNARFPRMMLTEFCSWEGDRDGFVTTPENQIDQMVQKVQKMEQSNLVEGYAWFMANGKAVESPYFSMFDTNSADSELSDLGKVYVHMSSFDKKHFFMPGDCIQTKDYVDATMDNMLVRLRPNSEKGSDLPLQTEFRAGSSADYYITVPQSGKYLFIVHYQADAETAFGISVDGRDRQEDLLYEIGPQWQDATLSMTLTEGRHVVRLSNVGETPFIANSFTFVDPNHTGVDRIVGDDGVKDKPVYNLSGVRQTSLEQVPAGVYVQGGKKFIRH